MPQARFMKMAIAAAAQGITAGQFPYGAAIVRRGKVVSCVHNVVVEARDVTMHAEVHAIRRACAKLKRTDLSGCEIYCTCEPCAMCMGACCFAGISAIYFGTRIRDKGGFGLRDPGVGASVISQLIESPPKVVAGFMRAECLELFGDYRKRLGR